MRPAVLACLSLCVLLTGCGIGDIAPASGPSSLTPIGNIKGSVHGGQQPIVGARVFLFAASTTGYGGNGIAASTANASKSLMTHVTTGSYPTTLDTDTTSGTSGDYYELTDANGNFNLTSEYTCTPGTQVYMYSIGGQPTPGVTNTAAGLIAILGQCPSTGTFAGTIAYIYINEVSTVAAAYALAPFATDDLHVGSSGTTLAKTGIANAFANANLLYDIQGSTLATLGGGARATTPNGNGTVPSNTINALANSIAACINSTGATSAACTTVTYSAGATGNAPNDTATEAIYIAQNPSYNVATVYNNASTFPPFSSNLTGPPNDWTFGINYTGGGLSTPYGIAIDASGNAWVVNNPGNTITAATAVASTLSKFSSQGVPLSGSSGFTGGGLQSSYALAIDGSGNVWAANLTANSLSKFSNAGAPISTSAGYTGGGLNGPTGIAIDGSGNVWTGNYNLNQLSKFSSSGTAISTAAGYTGGGLNVPYGIAIDGSGSVWAANANAAELSEFAYTGTATTTSAGYTGGGLTSPKYLAIDSAGNVWSSNSSADLSEFSNAGTVLSGSGGYTGGGVSNTFGIAIDGAGNVFTVNNTLNSIGEFSNAGTAISGTGGYTSGSMNAPYFIAIDGSGDLWVSNTGTNSVTEVIGVAAPVITPLAAGLPSTRSTGGTSNLGTRP